MEAARDVAQRLGWAHGALMTAVGASAAGRTEHAAMRLGLTEHALAGRPGIIAV